MTKQKTKSPPGDKMLVMKFGGTSIGTVKAMSQAVDIVKKTWVDWPHLVVVTSAISGVTALLLDSASKAARGDLQTFYQAAQEILSRHMEIISALVPDLARQSQVKQDINNLVSHFTNLCSAIGVLGEATPRALDTVAALGERLCVRVMAAALESAGLAAQSVEATQLIVTDDNFQAAHPDMPATIQRTNRILGPIISEDRIPVVTGFIAATASGITTTLGRGGSDYSAALLGVALDAEEVWIWTDVDGVMTADPRLVPHARTIPELSFREVADMANFGAKVLHPKTIHPIIEANIGLRVCNTFNPEHPGTRLLANEAAPNNGVIKAVTSISGLNLITLAGHGMLGVPGVAARIFTAVATTGTSVPLIAEAASEQSICFALSMDITEQAIAALKTAMANELSRRDIDRIWATDEVVIVTVVGSGMRNTPGISGRIFSALGERGLNVIAISYGSSEVSISLVVEGKDLQLAVRALHDLILD